MPGWFSRLFSAKPVQPPVVVPAEGGQATSMPAAPATVLVDSADGPPEVVELKPIGVVAPRNRQELIEELRKNYADVIDLVRKVNAHLDDQGRRQAELDARGERVLEVTQTVARTLAAIHEQQVTLARVLERLESGQMAVVEAIREQTRLERERGERLGSTLDGVRSLVEDTRRSTDATASAIAGVGEQLGQVGGATQRLVELAREDAGARRGLEAELLRRADQSRWLGVVAAICGLVLVAAGAAWILMRSGQ